MKQARASTRRGRLNLGALLLVVATTRGCGDDDGAAPPPAAPPDLRLNEFMAANAATLADEFGDYDDWAELANFGAEPASTAGFYLTDDLGTPNRWPLPDTTLAAGAVLLVWADGEPAEGQWHAPFRLAAAGEELGLFHGAELALADSTTFGAQGPDTSFARIAAGAWVFDPTPTPGRAND
jgi:hypothetical protein